MIENHALLNFSQTFAYYPHPFSLLRNDHLESDVQSTYTPNARLTDVSDFV